MAEAESKFCTGCRQTLLRDCFYRRSNTRDGLEYRCKACTEQARSRVQSEAARLKRREYDKRKYAKNRDRYLEYSRQYAKENPEKRVLYALNKKHKRRQLSAGGMSSLEYAAWRKAQPKVCFWCGKKCPDNWSADHFVPLAKGGKHVSSNLVIACRPCNSRKRDRDPIDFANELGRLL